MPLDLVLLRHAPAAERDPVRWPDDALRPLTAAGRRDARRVSEGLRRLDVRPERVATSPAVRCAQTARIAAPILGDPAPRVERWDELSFAGTPEGLLGRLAKEPASAASLLLVGHEPILGQLIGLLVYGEPVAAVRLRRAGAARIEIPQRRSPGAGRLDWLLTRGQLAAMAGPST